MAMRVGIVKVLSGSAVAISPEGTKRILQQGDIIFAFDVVKNESGERLVIEFDGGKTVALDSNGQLIINANVVADLSEESGENDPQAKESDVSALQKAILAGGDPTLIAEAPAAGLLENEGHGQTEITQRLNQQVTPDSGYETIGIAQDRGVLETIYEPVAHFPQGTVTLSLVSLAKGEGQLVEYILSISQPSAADTVVSIRIYSGATDTASETSDYSSGIYTITIPAGQTSVKFNVTTVEDTLVESPETFSAQIISATNPIGPVDINTTPLVATITDIADTPALTLSATSAEEGGSVSLTVTLSKVSTVDTSVTLNVFSGNGNSATPGSDYSAGPVTVIIPAGQTSASVNVATVNDNLYEGDETFSAVITAASNSAATPLFGNTPVTATITDNDTPTIRTISSPTAAEGSPLVYSVTLSNASTTPTSFPYTLGGGSANSNDYTPPSFSDGVTLLNGVLTVPAGVSGFTVTLPTVDDTTSEGSETVPLSIGTVSASGTLSDNDPLIATLSQLNGSQAREGGDVSFVVNLNKVSSRDTTVTVTIFTNKSDTAMAGVDYVAGTYTFIIPAGSTSVIVSVPTMMDALVEGNETFSAKIVLAENVNGAVGYTSVSVVGTILDNNVPVAKNDQLSTAEDVKLTVLPSVLLANDVDADGDTLVITSVGAATNGTVVLNADGTISFTPVTNYSGAASFIYTVNDGHGGTSTATANINVTPVADAPSLKLNLTAMEPVAATQTILKETFTDGFENAGWTPTKLAFNSFVDNPSTALNESTPFNSVAWQGNTSDSEWLDFWKVNTTTDQLTYNANGGSGSDDAYGMMAFNLANKGFSTVTQYAVSADLFGYDASQQNNGVGIVFGYTDDSNYFMARWENPGDIYLPGGSQYGNYPGVANQITLVQMVNGAPVYLGAYSNFATPNGFNMKVQVSQTDIKVYLKDDTGQNPGVNPSISYTYGTVVNGAKSAPAIKTIGMYVFDNDNGVEFDNVQVTQPSITGYQYSVNVLAGLNDKDGSESLSAVTLSNIPAGATLKGADGSAIAVINGSATIPVTSDVSKTITILSQAPLSGEQINAMKGAVTATESNGAMASATAGITELPTVYLVASNAAEGAPIIFELRQTVPSSVDTVVTLVIGQPGDTASSGSDYSGAGTRTVTIPAGAVSVIVSIPTIDNTVYENNETISAVITSATSAAGTVSAITTPVSVLIIDNVDYQAVTINNAWASEGNDLLFTVKLSKPSAQSISLDLEALGKTATIANSDFLATNFTYSTNYTGDYAPNGGITLGVVGASTWINASGTTGTVVTFAAGQTEMQVRVRTTEDDRIEPNETLTLRVKQVVSGFVNDSADTAIGTILTDDYVNSAGATVKGQDARVLLGGNGADTLVGGALNDVLIGGRGNDILTGGAGDDIFVIRHIGEGIDTITDYNKNSPTENDKLNIADVLEGVSVTQGNINNFVRVDATGMLSIDPNGTANGTNVVKLSGITSGADVKLIIDQLGTEVIVHVN